VLHVLPAGSVFDLADRVLVPQPSVVNAEDAEELAEAQRDMQQMARDIAAEDISPGTLRRRLARRRRTRSHQEESRR